MWWWSGNKSGWRRLRRGHHGRRLGWESEKHSRSSVRRATCSLWLPRRVTSSARTQSQDVHETPASIQSPKGTRLLPYWVTAKQGV